MDMLKPRKQPRRLIRGKSSHYRLHFLGSSEALINLDQPEGTQLLKDTTPSIAWRRDITPAGTNPRTTPHLSPGGEILHLRAQIQGRLTIYRLEQKGVGRGSVRRSVLKVREVIVKQTVTGTISKTTLEKCVRDEVVRADGVFRTHRYILELSKLNWRNKSNPHQKSR